MSEAAPSWTLSLDASTYVGTVAVIRDGDVVAEGQAVMRGEREERLMPAVVAALGQAGCAARDLTRVMCGAGPGSFTSLRIAGAIAKGLALANGAALFAVPSLMLIVAGQKVPLASGRYLAMLDAMRGERHAALIEVGSLREYHEIERLPRLPEAGIHAACARLGARAIGPREELVAFPHARGAALVLSHLLSSGPVPLDDWEPDYGRLPEAQVKWEASHGRGLPN